MDLRDLAYFETIAELGHLGRAAEKVCRTQPALTICVRRLEQELGAELFHRNGRRLELTPVGAMLLEHAREMRLSMAGGTRHLQDFVLGKSGNVRLGVAPTMTGVLLPPLMRALSQTAPDIALELVITAGVHLRQALRDQQIDLALLPVESREAFAHYPLLEDEVVVVAGPRHPLLRKSDPQISDVAAYRWLLPVESAAANQWLEATLTRHGQPSPLAQVRASSILYLPHLVLQSEMLTFLSRRNITNPDMPTSKLREVHIAELIMRRTFGLLHRPRGYLAPATRVLIDLIRKVAADMA